MTIQAPPIDESFAKLPDDPQIDRAVAALRENGFVVHVVDTVAAARALVLDLIPRDQRVFTATSETLRQSGITAAIDESEDFRSIRREAGRVETPYERIVMGATPDVIVGSVHAVTEEGHLVAASASGSQLAPYAAGARKVIWVVGAQKVVPDLETALRRIRSYSLPREWRRYQEAYGRPSVIGKILITERELFPERTTVVLIKEEIGF